MDTILIFIGAAIIGALIGYFIVQAIVKKANAAKVKEINQKSDLEIEKARVTAKRIIGEAETKAEKLVSQADNKHERIKQKKIREAKDKFAEYKEEFKEYKSKQKEELKEREVEVREKEKALQSERDKWKVERDSLEQEKSEIKSIRKNLDTQIKVLEKRKGELSEANDKQIKQLEQIAKLSESEAKEQLLDAVRAKSETEALALRKQTISDAKLTANKEAKKIVIQSIQRMCAEYTIENTVSVFNLESDDLKGQIIGREGRNIRALEAATGAELVVDDTPEAIVISSFDPIRREICRLSLKRLVADGRIHPARIEEVTAKVKKELDEQIVEIGERTIIELDIHGLHPYLVKMVGRMRFRSSYGQNLLKHSIETANICATMAAELGLSPKQAKMAKRAGLLHDISKVAEEDSELSHAILGMKICEKHGENAIVCNAVGAHHDEIEMNNMLSPIVQANKVNDGFADDLSFMISERIQNEMTYPGQIKVTVIRERRSTTFAT